MKTIIIYASKYGSTKEVATKIFESIEDAKITNVNELNESIEGYKNVILGSNLTAGLMNKKIKQLFRTINLDTQKVTVFITGLQKESLPTVITQNLSEEVIQNSFFVGGKLNFLEMNFFEKTVIKAVNKKANFIKVIDPKKGYDLLDYAEIDNMIKSIKLD